MDDDAQMKRRMKRMNTCTLTCTLSVGNQVDDRCNSINKNVEADRVPFYILSATFPCESTLRLGSKNLENISFLSITVCRIAHHVYANLS